MAFGQSYEEKIDSLIKDAIVQQAFPGATILVKKNGKDLFHKTYGYFTYDSLLPVPTNTLYDLASVTKIAAGLPVVMKLVQDGKLTLDDPFSNYWHPWKRKKDKKAITLREILAHQAGLEPYIIFLSKVRKKNGNLKKRLVRNQPSKRFAKQAYNNRYIKTGFYKKMYRTINRSPISKEKTYRYSGLFFLLLPELVQQLTGIDFETYLNQEIYEPLEITNLVFNPSLKQSNLSIIPTENDSIFRNDVTVGWVHDENAALLGGVSGNAGLFGTAEDLAKLMEFYRNLGKYKGRQIIDEEIVRSFIKIQYPENHNRRGLGFDKPLIGNDTLSILEAYPSPHVSKNSFGHAGFTGTFVWADPKEQLVYIFLSNRVYPSRTHRKIYDLKIREKVQDVFYNLPKIQKQ